MKLVLSRKGFDARHGGIASPILPDGTLVPLPIPHRGEATRLAQLPLPLAPDALEALLSDLSHGRIDGQLRVHADPQLLPPTGRPDNWRPNLGQAGAAACHLRRRGVGPGDVFLFFGWFRRVGWCRGRWAYVAGAPDEHRIFGWLEVGEVLKLHPTQGDLPAVPGWVADHPHRRRPDLVADRCNTLYVAAQRSRFRPGGRPAAGRFQRALAVHRLTAPAAACRSLWRLPGWMLPGTGVPALSYHGDPALWQRNGGAVLLRSARIGQEFVLDLPPGPAPPAWLRTLIGAEG